MSTELFWHISLPLINHGIHNSIRIGIRRFRSFFGISPEVCSLVWELTNETRPKGSKPIHLLMALLFLKQYNNEHLNHSICNVDEKTFRKWCWIFVEILANLPVICWEDRYNGNSESNIHTSIDGTDCKISEPSPFDAKWYSHKFRSAGLRYEVAISIETGEIVWVHGGVPCGLYSDLRLARSLFTSFLDTGELVLADRGYRDQNYFMLASTRCHKKILARHETVNSRLKSFNILSQRFRHSLYRHPRCFNAVANLVQLLIQNGEPLFNI